MKTVLSAVLGIVFSSQVLAAEAPRYVPKIIPHASAEPLQVLSLNTQPDVKYPVEQAQEGAQVVAGSTPVISATPEAPSPAAKLPTIVDASEKPDAVKQQYMFEVTFTRNNDFEQSLRLAGNVGEPLVAQFGDGQKLADDDTTKDAYQDIPCVLENKANAEHPFNTKFEASSHLGMTRSVMLYPLATTENTVKMVISSSYRNSDVTRALKVSDSCIILDGMQNTNVFTTVAELKDGEVTHYKIGESDMAIKPVFVQ